jgi:phage tail sheath protein FI
MPVTPTFPGIYIEEIQSSAHTITAAPTNIAVFVGYTHPFKTQTLVFNPVTRKVDTLAPQFGQAVQLFSFSDYERNFGGFFSSPLFSPDPTAAPNDYFGSVTLAVNQFFLNGGTECYVVGLQAKPGGVALAPGFKDISGITFTAREPTDPAHQMTVTITPKGTDVISPLSPPGPDLADITITYGAGAGAVVEVYRKVSLSKIEATIGTAANPVSNLVTVSPTGTGYPHVFPAQRTWTLSDMWTTSPPTPFLSIAADFNAIFQTDTPLDKVPIFNLMVLPGVTSNIVLSEALAFCELKRAFLIIDPPQPDGVLPPSNWIGDYVGAGDSLGNIAPLAPNAAIYFPYLTSNDPQTGDPITLAPAATVAGIYATTDTNRGVWKAPAGLETTILGVTGVVPSGQMSNARQGTLNTIALNCLRTFPGVGTVVFGARTSVGADTNTSQQQWKYVPVRRMALFLEQTLYNNLGWVVFEPNDTPLWTAIKTSIEAFMLGLFRQGAFQGKTPSEAFQVKCDNQTTTQADIDNGIVNIVVAFAPLKPAEFVIIKIAQLAGQTQTS